MPPTHDQIDLETLLREAVSSIAVAAYARKICLSAHIDNRLPCRASGDARALGEFLRRGLMRTAEAGQTRRIALALWYDEADGTPRILLEACRAMEDGDTPLTGMADLWTLPLDGGIAHPALARQSGGVETVLISLPCELDPEAPIVAQKWAGAFSGRFILHVRDLLFDRERCQASLAAAGLEAAFTTTPRQAKALIRRRADAGQAVDFLLLDGHQLGAAAVTLARDIRADKRLAGTRIVLTGNTRGQKLSGDEIAIFDAVPRFEMPWRRLMDVLHDLSDAPGSDTPVEAHKPQPAGNRATGTIPALTGRRILIAEDVATNQMLLMAVLAPTGADVEVVADGAAVLKRHSEAPADLILMDLQMPGMGGIAAMRHLREMEGKPGVVPVVALTAYARSADRQLALEAGMDAYLAKPIVVTEFYDLLRRLLPGNGAGDGARDGAG